MAVEQEIKKEKDDKNKFLNELKMNLLFDHD